MKTKLFLITLLFIVGCISTGSKGYIKTKDNTVKKFENAYVITFSKEIMVVEDQAEMLINKRDIKEFHIETDNYR
jgi:hypothetical protein